MIQYDFLEHRTNEENEDYFFKLAVKLFAIEAVFALALNGTIQKKEAFEELLKTALKLQPVGHGDIHCLSSFVSNMTKRHVKLPAFQLALDRNDFSPLDIKKLKQTRADIQSLGRAAEAAFQTLTLYGPHPDDTDPADSFQINKTCWLYEPMNTDISVAQMTGWRVAVYILMLATVAACITSGVMLADRIEFVFAALASAVVAFYGIPCLGFSAVDALEDAHEKAILANHKIFNPYHQNYIKDLNQTFNATQVVDIVETRMTPPTKQQVRV